MSALCCDTGMLVGLVVPGDQHAETSVMLAETWIGELYTTSFVVAEAARRLQKGKQPMKGPSGEKGRTLAVLLLKETLDKYDIAVIHPTEEVAAAARAVFVAWGLPWDADLFDFTTREVIQRRGEKLIGSPDGHFDSWGIERLL